MAKDFNWTFNQFKNFQKILSINIILSQVSYYSPKMHNLQTICGSIMTFNYLTLSKWVLSPIWQAYHKVVKNLFPLHIWRTNENTEEILLQSQFYKIFTSVLSIIFKSFQQCLYDLWTTWIYNQITKKRSNSCLDNNNLTDQYSDKSILFCSIRFCP